MNGPSRATDFSPVKHGDDDNASFYVNWLALRKRYPNSHFHADYEIGVITGGKGELYYDGTWYPLEAGDGYFLDCTVPHGHAPRPGGFIENLYSHISYDAMASLAHLNNYARLVRPFALLRSGLVRPILKNTGTLQTGMERSLKHAVSDHPFASALSWIEMVASLVAIGCEVEKQVSPSQGEWADRYSSVISRALQFIGARYREPISLGDISHYSGLSTSRLSYLFAEIMHTSPIAFRNHLRISRSIEMLRGTSKKIEHIAAECGFESLAQFRALFKRITGNTPHSLRTQ